MYIAADEFDERHKKYLNLAQRCARPRHSSARLYPSVCVSFEALIPCSPMPSPAVRRAYGLTIREPNSPRAEGALVRNMWEVRRNRFVVKEQVAGVRTYTRNVKEKDKWKLETSIWAPRVKYSDAKAFFDTEEVRSSPRHSHLLLSSTSSPHSPPPPHLLTSTLAGAEANVQRGLGACPQRTPAGEVHH